MAPNAYTVQDHSRPHDGGDADLLTAPVRIAPSDDGRRWPLVDWSRYEAAARAELTLNAEALGVTR